MSAAGGLRDPIPGVAGLVVAICIAVGLAREGGRRAAPSEAVPTIDPTDRSSTGRTAGGETGLDTGPDST
jgi:hypothetical protein